MGGGGARKNAEEAVKSQKGVIETQLGLSKDILAESSPWRTIAGNYYKDVAKGGDAALRANAPKTNAATINYQTALNQVKEMPLGGTRDAAIRNIRMGEAQTKAGIAANGVDDAIMRLAQLGSGGVDTAMSGMSAAGGGYANIANAYNQQAQGKSGAMGQMAGAGGGIAAAAIAA